MDSRNSVVFCFSDFADNEFHRVDRVHFLQAETAQNPHAIEVGFGNQQFFFSCSGTDQIKGREDAAVGNAPIQMQFHVARALEFFKDNFVHAAAGVNEGRGDNGQAAAIFYVAGCSEKAFGLVQRVRTTPPERTFPEGGTTVL